MNYTGRASRAGKHSCLWSELGHKPYEDVAAVLVLPGSHRAGRPSAHRHLYRNENKLWTSHHAIITACPSEKQRKETPNKRGWEEKNKSAASSGLMPRKQDRKQTNMLA